MSRLIDRVTLAASLLAPHVALDWGPVRHMAATKVMKARVGCLSDVFMQGVDARDDPHGTCGGLSAWSRARDGGFDPFPIRFWGHAGGTDAAAWRSLQDAVHHRLLVLAQAHVFLSRRPLDDILSGLRVTDPDAVRRSIFLLSGRKSRAEHLPALIADLHRPPASRTDRTVR